MTPHLTFSTLISPIPIHLIHSTPTKKHNLISISSLSLDQIRIKIRVCFILNPPRSQVSDRPISRSIAMEALHGPVICPILRSKQALLFSTTSRALRSKRSCRVGIQVCSKRNLKRSGIRCSYSSSDSGSTAENESFNENDGEYVNSSILEAVEVKSGADGFMIKMRDGKRFRCVHNNPQSGGLPDYAPHPAIVLKMEDGSDLLLPIIVLEMPSVLLMAAVRNVQIPRPTLYQITKEMIEKMGYEVKLVRVTKRVHEAYFAQLYLSKVGNEEERISFDLRPSDAINIAARCKVPIQVNKYLAYSDGMRIVEPANLTAQAPHSDGLLFSALDRPDGKPCVETKEFDIVRNMLIAAVEERYKDAAQWKVKLAQLRSKRRNWA